MENDTELPSIGMWGDGEEFLSQEILEKLAKCSRLNISNWAKDLLDGRDGARKTSRRLAGRKYTKPRQPRAKPGHHD